MNKATHLWIHGLPSIPKSFGGVKIVEKRAAIVVWRGDF